MLPSSRITMLSGPFWAAIPLLLSAQSSGEQLRELLPQGRVTVEILEMWSPPRLTELTQRVQAAAQSDPTWWQDYIRKAAPGEPLPYHPKLGLTEPEYREFLALTDSIRMKPARTAQVLVESTPSGWKFGTASSIAALRGIVIDTVKNMITSPFGDLAADDPITPTEGQRATGPWGGPRWSREEVDTNALSGTIAQLAIGRHSQTGRTVIYYDARRLQNGQQSARESLFLLVVR